MRKFTYYISVLSIIVSLLSSCYPMDDNYAWLVEDGPIVYLNKADTAVALGGKEQIKIKWFKQWDSRATVAKVFWNGDADSVVIDLTENPTEYIITSLPESVYSFDLYFYSPKGLKSCATSIVGKTYGTTYEVLLLNRTIKFVSIPTEGEWTDYVQLECAAFKVAGYIGSELVYKDNNNVEKTIKIMLEETDMIRIPKDQVLNAASGAVFQYRSLYTPEPEGFKDIFYSKWATIELPM